MAKGLEHDASVSLSSELAGLIRIHFAPEAHASVRETLLSYAASSHDPEVDRVQYDLLHLGAGNPDKVRRLADVALMDPRDVMVAEYFRVGARDYPYAWARRHAVNTNWDEPPEKDESLGYGEFSLIRSTNDTGGIPLLRSLRLKFSDSTKLSAFANLLSALAEPGAAVDLSAVIPYRNYRNPSAQQRTKLRCFRDDAPAILSYDGIVLSWDGSAAYWTNCRSMCLKLADAGRGILEITPDTASQKVLASLSKIATYI